MPFKMERVPSSKGRIESLGQNSNYSLDVTTGNFIDGKFGPDILTFGGVTRATIEMFKWSQGINQISIYTSVLFTTDDIREGRRFPSLFGLQRQIGEKRKSFCQSVVATKSQALQIDGLRVAAA